ncbi:MAG: FHA domain-containing protein [Lentisphaeraceae bacterium]|nr:FHA domain-containing protein [Lentisphaeraceae bacterium]
MKTTVADIIDFLESDSGNEELAWVFFERYRPHILNILKSRGCPLSDLEDVCQDVCITLWNKRGKFIRQRKGSLRSFIYLLCSRAVFNYYRKLGRSKEDGSENYELHLEKMYGNDESAVKSEKSIDDLCTDAVNTYLRNVGDDTYKNVLIKLFEDLSAGEEVDNAAKASRDKYNFAGRIIEKVKDDARQHLSEDIDEKDIKLSLALLIEEDYLQTVVPNSPKESPALKRLVYISGEIDKYLQDKEAMPCLLDISAGRQLKLTDKNTFSIGRLRGDYAVDCQGVSRSHCKLIKEDGFWSIEDLASANGTIVNEQILKSERTLLNNGDFIQLHEQCRFIFCDEAGE